MRVVTLQTEALDEPTRSEVVRLCVMAHREEEFVNLFVYIPTGGRHFLAYLDQTLVGHAVVTTRWLQPEGLSPLRTAYVDAVAIRPESQGQGAGSALMRYLAGELPKYEIACLETDSPDFYAALGWRLWRGPLAGRDAQGLIPTPDQQGIMVLPLPTTPPLDLDAPLTIEADGRIW